MRGYERTNSKRLSAALLLATAGLATTTTAASALTCGPEPVTARSENSRFEWTAKAKARANWRVKVRKLPGLGPDYANWARAANPQERCLSGPSGVICILTGAPCKP